MKSIACFRLHMLLLACSPEASSKRQSSGRALRLLLLFGIASLHTTVALQPSASRPTLLVVGMGRLGRQVARLAALEGRSVVGTVRPGTEVSTAIADSVDSVISVDELKDFLDKQVSTGTLVHAVVTVPPVEGVFHIPPLLLSAASVVEWIGVVSTTGVYAGGDVLDEMAPTATTPTALRYLAWEDSFTQRKTVPSDGGSLQQNCAIFRCAGLYGAESSALHTVMREGRPTAAPSSPKALPMTNRIHRTDAARAILAATGTTTVSALSGKYNLVDNEPAPRDTVLHYAADLLEAKGYCLPKTQEMSKRRRSVVPKRVINTRLKSEVLCQPLEYPTYREGLAAVLAEAMKSRADWLYQEERAATE